MQLNQEELFEALVLLAQKIEECGASPELTDAVILASDLSASVGNRFNRSDPDRAKMVRAKLKPQPDAEAARQALNVAREALKPVIEYVQTLKNRVPIEIVVSALQVKQALDA